MLRVKTRFLGGAVTAPAAMRKTVNTIIVEHKCCECLCFCLFT